ncbi:hypothetical protein KSP35_10545 [Aquihabitans sp. G128]|uniref:hypothetical protein n=1 Tax=Aquihabitans sp. G128 TaxID=2849779 RepID=UPI001C24D03F|nr:hypothetical protein [Aquihabitans sp. G128]QXC63178.1 hypothetical protein KSP35_10545 [Aquihabitans sp. G128]
MTPEPDDRRAALLASKLRLLAAERWELGADARPGGFPKGATLVDPTARRAWVLVEGDAERRLGGALAVSLRAGVEELHVIVDDPVAAGIVARRASAFRFPVHVWRTEGRELVAVAPAATAADPAPAPEAELYRPVLRAADLEPVVEGGHLVGELLGLEVARVVVADDGSAHVEAGVGRFDREVGAMMFAELGETDALARAVDIVRRYRTASAERHPLNHLVPERWLRSVLVARPELVGATSLRSVGSAVPRQSLNGEGVATAVGEDADGRPLVVVCSTGVYLDLVPSAADDRLTHGPDARLVLAVPERDAVPITADLAALLTAPAEIAAIPGDWRAPTGGSA